MNDERRIKIAKLARSQRCDYNLLMLQMSQYIGVK